MFFGFDILSREFIAIWVVLALINCNLAQTKNKDAFSWFVISLVLGPLATLWLAVSSKNYDD